MGGMYLLLADDIPDIKTGLLQTLSFIFMGVSAVFGLFVAVLYFRFAFADTGEKRAREKRRFFMFCSALIIVIALAGLLQILEFNYQQKKSEYTPDETDYSIEPDDVSHPKAGGFLASVSIGGPPMITAGGDGQCVELIKYYLEAVTGTDKNSIALGDGHQVAAAVAARFPSNFQSVTYSADNLPQAGDIISFQTTSGNRYGHVAIVYSVSPNGTMSVVHQNITTKYTNQKDANGDLIPIPGTNVISLEHNIPWNSAVASSNRKISGAARLIAAD